jgi:hypothetical protein
VLIDMTGNAGVRREVHEVTRNVLQASIMVGATHWEGATLVGDSLPGPEPVFFFARPSPTNVPPRSGRRYSHSASVRPGWRSPAG